ncbi:uncharacterized protein N0V89_011789 [Didymosphaeria variabile]|uniref:Uncharacterized protein n=1 Tax=Didymosphaeria variabile TaxID=1932322 RepID=A0A9W8XBT9_9PLEO|nr:uncharacterized protein N0V89_011789 [Didymosphaeria variabile]KAJ4345655.1 hypothetical protein N0V89_011789 [Didymosphaeria variabile]
MQVASVMVVRQTTYQFKIQPGQAAHEEALFGHTAHEEALFGHAAHEEALINSILQEIVELLLNDGVTQPLLSKASQIGIASERIERQLRALLKDLGADLKTESETVEERRIAKFIALNSRPVALAVVKSIEGFEDAARDVQGKERVEDSSEEDTESETDEPVQENEENNLARAKRSVVKSAAFANMHQQLWHLVFPTLNAKMLAYVDKAGEDLTGADKNSWLSEGRALATELFDVRLSSVNVCKNMRTSTLDRTKHTIEAWTEETWNWWPLRLPLPYPDDKYT